MNNDKMDKIKWDINDYSSIKPEYLDTFEYEYVGKDTTIKIETDEFGAVCPWSGLPDFGKIIIEYTPVKLIMEIKSFKYYLYTFRNTGIYQEHAINRIYDDIKSKIKPKNLKITLIYNIRGGIETTVTRDK